MRLLDITKKADKFIGGLQPRQFKQIYSTIMRLRENPRPHDSQMLHGYKDYFRVDVGEFRVIYQFDAKVIYILMAGKRNDDEVYKKLDRGTH